MGHLNSFSASGGENFPKHFQKFICPGGMFKLRFDWYITPIDLTKDVMGIFPGHCEISIYRIPDTSCFSFPHGGFPWGRRRPEGFFSPPPDPCTSPTRITRTFLQDRGDLVACCKTLGSWKQYFYSAHKCESFVWVLIAI